MADIDWTNLTAPTLDDFEEMAAAAFAALPAEFRALAGSVPCVVAEFPDDETISEMHLESEFDILGLFEDGRGDLVHHLAGLETGGGGGERRRV